MDETRGPQEDGPQPSEDVAAVSPGAYPAVYETPGVEFPPGIEDEFPAAYEPAPGFEAPTEVQDGYAAAYEPAPGGPHSAPYSSAELPATQAQTAAQSAALPAAQALPATQALPRFQAQTAAQSAPLPAATDQPAVTPQPGPAPAHRCPWCSAPTPPGATHCPSCHASLAEREALGDILIPGVTGIDPALVHRNDTMNKVMSVPGAKLGAISGTLGIGLSIAATLAQEMERRSEIRPPSLGIGVPPTEALELAQRLDRATEVAREAGSDPVPPVDAAPTPPASPSPAPAAAPTAEPAHAPQVSPWADTPWAAEIAPMLANPEVADVTAEQTIEPAPDKADD